MSTGLRSLELGHHVVPFTHSQSKYGTAHSRFRGYKGRWVMAPDVVDTCDGQGSGSVESSPSMIQTTGNQSDYQNGLVHGHRTGVESLIKTAPAAIPTQGHNV